MLGDARWYLGMRITQNKEFISLDQDQFAKNTISRIEKSFKHPFKTKDFPILISFVPTTKDSPTTDEQIKETKTRSGNLYIINPLLELSYISHVAVDQIFVL